MQDVEVALEVPHCKDITNSSWEFRESAFQKVPSVVGTVASGSSPLLF